MIIETVRKANGGYKVNNQFFIPDDDPENEYYKNIQNWILEGGRVEDIESKSQDQTKEEKIAVIKIQVAKRITDNYPEWKQVNYMASVSEIHNKEIVAMKADPFIGQYQLTVEELQTLKEANTCKKFITAIRTKSNQLQLSLDTMTPAELEAFDPSNDLYWQ